MPLIIQDLKLQILKLFAGAPQHGGHKFNLLGRTYQPDGLEASLGVTYDKDQRGWIIARYVARKLADEHDENEVEWVFFEALAELIRDLPAPNEGP